MRHQGRQQPRACRPRPSAQQAGQPLEQSGAEAAQREASGPRQAVIPVTGAAVQKQPGGPSVRASGVGAEGGLGEARPEEEWNTGPGVDPGHVGAACRLHNVGFCCPRGAPQRPSPLLGIFLPTGPRGRSSSFRAESPLSQHRAGVGGGTFPAPVDSGWCWGDWGWPLPGLARAEASRGRVQAGWSAGPHLGTPLSLPLPTDSSPVFLPVSKLCDEAPRQEAASALPPRPPLPGPLPDSLVRSETLCLNPAAHVTHVS